MSITTMELKQTIHNTLDDMGDMYNKSIQVHSMDGELTDRKDGSKLYFRIITVSIIDGPDDLGYHLHDTLVKWYMSGCTHTPLKDILAELAITPTPEILFTSKHQLIASLRNYNK